MKKSILCLLVGLVACCSYINIGCDVINPSLSSESFPSSGGTIQPAQGTYDKGLVVQVEATPNQGYRFSHWEGSASGQSPTVQVTMDADKKVVANFIKTYKLFVSISPDNGGSVLPSSNTYDEGQSINLFAQPSNYYEFIGWSGDITGSSQQVAVNMDSDKNIVANFKKRTFNLELNSNIPNAGTLDPANGSFNAGSKVTITVTANNGYRFREWSGSATGANKQIEILMDNDKTITANFVKQYDLILNSEPLDAGRIVAATGPHDEGSIVDLQAIPNFPYYVDTWIGATTATGNTAAITMDSDKTITAVFERTIKGETIEERGSLSSGEMNKNPTDSFTITLNKYEWVQGAVILSTNPQISAIIRDPYGNLIKDLGAVSQANFVFMAEYDGEYTISFNNKSIFWGDYNLTYSIYHLP